MTEKQIGQVLTVYLARILDLKKDPSFLYILIFKNHGEAAGAFLENSHSQLIALPIRPKLVREEMSGAKDYFRYKERYVYCDIIRQETETCIRIIEENDDFVAMAPFAPRFPFEFWTLPKTHISNFEEISDEQIRSLAPLLKNMLMRLDLVLDYPAYNFVVHSSPHGEGSNEHYHWHIELMPRLTHVAGFEGGTGFYINPTPPEESAKLLREADLNAYAEAAATRDR